MRARAEHGFTLVELLVTMAITVVVFGATLSVLDVFQSNNRFDQLRHETQDNARTAMDRLARELRNVAAPGVVYFGALEEAEPYSLAFQTIDTSTTYAWGSNRTHAMMVRYCLDNSSPSNEILWKYVKRWSTEEGPELPSSAESKKCPDKHVGDWESESQLVQHVTNQIGGQNRPLFVYSATGVPKIVAVESNLFIDLNPGHSRPGESQLTSGVSLRNANRQPTVAFTATEVNKGYVLLNASESRDPDGLALTYRWWMDSVKLSTTAQQWQTEALASKSTHTFKLEVANPGGLSNSTEKTVKIA